MSLEFNPTMEITPINSTEHAEICTKLESTLMDSQGTASATRVVHIQSDTKIQEMSWMALISSQDHFLDFN
jgi:hypothetical protein